MTENVRMCLTFIRCGGVFLHYASVNTFCLECMLPRALLIMELFSSVCVSSTSNFCTLWRPGTHYCAFFPLLITDLWFSLTRVFSAIYHRPMALCCCSYGSWAPGFLIVPFCISYDIVGFIRGCWSRPVYIPLFWLYCQDLVHIVHMWDSCFEYICSGSFSRSIMAVAIYS